MTPTPAPAETAATDPAPGAWRLLLRSRLVGRAEPLFVDAGGLRSAASIWSGALVWAQLLRAHPERTPVVVWHTERLALLQLLVAALWDGRTLQIEAGARTPWPGAWCLDGRQLLHEGQTVCPLGEGGWPDLAGPARMSTLEMLAVAPMQGQIVVRGRPASHGALWLALGAPLAPSPGAPASATHGAPPGETPGSAPSAAPAPEPRSEVLPPFDLAALATPQDLLNDALLPLLRSHEVWERGALPAD